MTRSLLIHWLALTTLLGPLLCCCSARMLFVRTAATSVVEAEEAPTCCCCCKEAQPRQPNRDDPEPHSCPCKQPDRISSGPSHSPLSEPQSLTLPAWDMAAVCESQTPRVATAPVPSSEWTLLPTGRLRLYQILRC